jgi:hypothetical protein
MKLLTLTTFISLLALVVSCGSEETKEEKSSEKEKVEKKSYKNKPVYNVAVGESVEIYYSTNSCCFYCVANQMALKNVELIAEKNIKDDPEDCQGCNYVSAFVFKATSVGTDTVFLKNPTASSTCEDITFEPEVYVINVK